MVPTMNLLYVDMSYCALCDRYFPSDDARAQHVQMSRNHPACQRCDRRFPNMNSLRNHWVYSPRHHYCIVCEKDFKTPAGLRAHIEYAAVHRDDSDDDDSDDDSDIHSEPEGWEDEIGAHHFPEENVAGQERLEDESLRQRLVIHQARDEYRAYRGEHDASGSSDEDRGWWNRDDSLAEASAEADVEEQEDWWQEDEEWDVEEEEDMYRRWSVGLGPIAIDLSSLDIVEEGANSSAQGSGSDVDVDAGDASEGDLSQAPIPHCREGVCPSSSSSSSDQLENKSEDGSAAPAFEYTCPLCLEVACNTRATRCGHVFCTGCIFRALLEKRHCPICRKHANPKELRKIYLGPAA